MCPDRPSIAPGARPGCGGSRQRGIGLVAAIFLIVVVAGLVAAIGRMVRTNADVFAQDVTSQRAFLAAESGAELGLNRVFAPAGAPACGNWSWDLAAMGLSGCRVDVACSSEVVDGTPHYTLESDGRCSGGGVVAERRVLVRAVP
jgi:MSHA biogenesis protein MshP